MLPEGTVIFAPEDRDDDGYYLIGPGQVFVFPFLVPFLDKITIKVIHTYKNSQDYSLKGWFSSGPLDYNVFEGHGNWDSFSLPRELREMDIFDNLLVEEIDPRKSLASNSTFYFNVRNLANSQTTFKVLFSN